MKEVLALAGLILRMTPVNGLPEIDFKGTVKKRRPGPNLSEISGRGAWPDNVKVLRLKETQVDSK